MCTHISNVLGCFYIYIDSTGLSLITTLSLLSFKICSKKNSKKEGRDKKGIFFVMVSLYKEDFELLRRFSVNDYAVAKAQNEWHGIFGSPSASR
jgi:hypothetical protein